MKCKYSFFLLICTYFFIAIAPVMSVVAMHDSGEQLKEDWLKTEGVEREAKDRLAQAEKNEKDARRNQDLLVKKAEDLEKTIEKEKSKGTATEIIKALQTRRENALSKAEEWGGKIQEKENERLNAQRDVTRAEQALEKIKTEAKKLGVLLESTSKAVPDFKLFRNTLENDLRDTKPEESTLILAKAMLDLDQNFPSYRDQREALKEIVALAAQNDPELAKQAQNRINQITTVLVSSKKPINETDRTLKLYDKIPSDQLKRINDEFTNVWIAQLRDAAISDDPKVKESMKKTLQETQAAIRHYNLGQPGDALIQELQAGIDSLAQPKIAETSVAIRNEEPMFQQAMQGARALTANLLPGNVVEGIRIGVDVVAAFVHFTAGEMVSGVLYTMREGPAYLNERLNTLGGQLQVQGEAIGRIAQELHEVPNLVSALDNTAVEVDAQLGRVANMAHSRFIPGPISRAILERVAAPMRLIEMFKNHEALINQLARMGGYVAENIAQVSQAVGKRITNVTGAAVHAEREEQVRILTNIEKAELLIAQERAQLRTPNKFEALTKPIIDFGKKIGTYIRDLFDNSKVKLTRATNNYQVAKEEYLKVLGFTREEILKNPDVNAIAEKLKVATLDPSKKGNLDYATKMLAQASVDIANVYSDIANKLNSTMVNVEFLIKAWDRAVYLPEEKPTISDMVQSVFDLRDMKISYLQAIKDGIEEIHKTIQGTDPSFAQMGNDLTQRLTSIVGSQIIETIDQYQDVITNINAQLSNQKQQLESFIKR